MKNERLSSRREFLKSTTSGGLSFLATSQWATAGEPVGKGRPLPQEKLRYRLSLHVPTRLYDGRRCWCHPRAGIVPGAGKQGMPRVVMTMNVLSVSGSDVFKAMYGLETDDLGQTWSPPRKLPGLAVRSTLVDGQRRPVAVSDFWPCWHRATNTLLGTGHSVVYTPDWKVVPDRPRATVYSTYDPQTEQWAPWQRLAMPDGEKFRHAGAGCTQRYDLPDGTVLLPIYYRPPGKNSRAIVVRCSFDGQRLRVIGLGNELAIDDNTRGLHEPSLTRYQGEFFLTIRNDRRGYVTRSGDGLHFGPITPWRFDDGKELGNYNTQQHWVTHSDGLFLVYTRRAAHNDHVFRHRAPLFMARVDPKRLRVIRDSERIVVPERGARLGNFGVTDISPQETWITVAEWMQTWGPRYVLPVDNRYGSDGSVFVARVRWSKPNLAFQSSPPPK